MISDACLIAKLKRILAEDPRTAVLLLEILGPPPGLSSGHWPACSVSVSPDKDSLDCPPEAVP